MKEQILLDFLENEKPKLDDVIKVLKILLKEKFIIEDDYLIDRLIIKRDEK